MQSIITNRFTKPQQYLLGTLSVLLVSGICYLLSSYIGYKMVALLLLFTVSIVAMFFDIMPVLVTAVLSSLLWDFFFIPPKFTFFISQPEDVLMLLTYFFIAMVNATLTFKIRQIEKVARKKEEEEKTLKLYNTLLNSLSHELRTPISVVIGASDNLQNYSDKLSEQNKKELVHEISTAALRLNQHVENLLNMSRLESGVVRPKKDWVDVSELIYGVVREIEHNKITHKISVHVPADLPLVRLDKGMLEPVLHNLLINAVNYTANGSNIHVRATLKIDNLTLIVEDDGLGFPKNEISKVFDKFYRLKDSRTGGTGLGLSIVKGFVEAHNGTIILENIASGGARFTIALPVDTVNEQFKQWIP